MKTKIIAFLLAVGFAGTALAMDRADLDNRIRNLSDRLVELQSNPAKAIPAADLRAAKGILLLDRTKAGFLFAYQGGSGVAMVREASGQWSPAAFVKANGASLGFQIGGEQRFVVVLMMTTNATRLLTDQQFNFAGEARGTAGDQSAGAQTQPSHPPSVLVYTDRQGFYGGVAIKGGAISADTDANQFYYADYFAMSDILFGHKVKSTPASDYLARAMDRLGRANSNDTSSR